MWSLLYPAPSTLLQSIERVDLDGMQRHARNNLEPFLMYGCIIPVPFKTSLYIRIYKKSSYKFEIRWTMHEPQSIVLKNHHRGFLHLLSIWNSCNVVRQNGREFPPPPPVPPSPRGNVAGVWEVGGRLKLLREFKPERRYGSTRVPGHAFLA
jgi:hypothetical protein